jgi:hypothetical protein
MDDVPHAHYNWHVIERYYFGRKVDYATSYHVAGQTRWPPGLPPVGARVVEIASRFSLGSVYVVDSVTLKLDADGDGGNDAEAIVRLRRVRPNKSDTAQ